MYFRFRQVKSKLIGDVLMKKQKAATRCIIFFSLLKRALPIDTPYHTVLVDDKQRTEKGIREIKFGNYRRSKFEPHRLLAQDASLRQYVGAAQEYPSLIL
jgi:hypothetical protein